MRDGRNEVLLAANEATRQNWPAERTASRNAEKPEVEPAGHGDGRRDDPDSTLCLLSPCCLGGTDLLVLFCAIAEFTAF